MQPSGFTLVAFCRVCSNLGSVIPHTLHKLRLRCLNGKKAIAAIPNAVQELTSLSILGHEFFASKKHRYCLEPAASVPLLSVHPCTLLNDKFTSLESFITSIYNFFAIDGAISPSSILSVNPSSRHL